MVTRDARVVAASGYQSPGAEYDDPGIEYPSSDGEPMAESKEQYTPLTYTVGVLELYFQGRDDVFIAGDLLVYYRMNDNETRVAPDVFVVFGAAGSHARRSWLVWREGAAPDFVMEIASLSTWERDAEEKRRIYADMGVSEYWRFDPTGECFSPPLVGERLVEGEYRELPLEGDGAGMLWGRSDLLGLYICVLPGLELRLYDPAGGRWLRSLSESEAAWHTSEAARRAAEAALRESEAARQAVEAALRESEAARQAAEAEREAEADARLLAEAALRESEAARLSAEAERERLRELLRILKSGQ